MNEINRKENLHVVFWLIKDFAWISGYKILGVSLAIPTIILAAYLTVITKKIRSSFYHNLAILFWILGNSIWMFGEFYFEDQKRIWALPFFFIGLAIIAYYYLFEGYLAYQKKKARY
jgi:hypothetical protein